MSFSTTRLASLLVVLAMGLTTSPVRALFAVVGGAAPGRLLRPRRSRSRSRYSRGNRGRRGSGLMRNPYAGYLNGAARLTTANARYQLTIQQARLVREQARRSALQTRRATLEERQYELSLKPDPEKIRQEQLARALQRSRNNPPLPEIWSGKALNDLLRGIQTAQSNGSLGQDVPLSPDVLKHINLTAGTTYGGIGLLKHGGKLTWPAILRESIFDTERARVDEQMRLAVKQAKSGEVNAERLHDIGIALKQLESAIDGRVADITPSQYIEATRFARELRESYAVLQQSDVAKYFGPDWKPHGSTVEELVRDMTQKGLRFGPAVSGEESYYTSLHRSLVDYDIGNASLAPLR